MKTNLILIVASLCFCAHATAGKRVEDEAIIKMTIKPYCIEYKIPDGLKHDGKVSLHVEGMENVETLETIKYGSFSSLDDVFLAKGLKQIVEELRKKFPLIALPIIVKYFLGEATLDQLPIPEDTPDFISDRHEPQTAFQPRLPGEEWQGYCSSWMPDTSEK